MKICSHIGCSDQEELDSEYKIIIFSNDFPQKTFNNPFQDHICD